MSFLHFGYWQHSVLSKQPPLPSATHKRLEAWRSEWAVSANRDCWGSPRNCLGGCGAGGSFRKRNRIRCFEWRMEWYWGGNQEDQRSWPRPVSSSWTFHDEVCCSLSIVSACTLATAHLSVLVNHAVWNCRSLLNSNFSVCYGIHMSSDVMVLVAPRSGRSLCWRKWKLIYFSCFMMKVWEWWESNGCEVNCLVGIQFICLLVAVLLLSCLTASRLSLNVGAWCIRLQASRQCPRLSTWLSHNSPGRQKQQCAGWFTALPGWLEYCLLLL